MKLKAIVNGFYTVIEVINDNKDTNLTEFINSIPDTLVDDGVNGTLNGATLALVTGNVDNYVITMVATKVVSFFTTTAILQPSLNGYVIVNTRTCYNDYQIGQVIKPEQLKQVNK